MIEASLSISMRKRKVEFIRGGGTVWGDGVMVRLIE